MKEFYQKIISKYKKTNNRDQMHIYMVFFDQEVYYIGPKKVSTLLELIKLAKECDSLGILIKSGIYISDRSFYIYAGTSSKSSLQSFDKFFVGYFIKNMATLKGQKA